MNTDSRVPAANPAAAAAGPAAGLLSRAAAGAAALLPVGLGLCLLVSWLASLAIPVRKYLLAGDFSWLPGAGIYLLVAGGLGWWLWKAQGTFARRLVTGLIGAAVLIKLVLAFATVQLPLNTDQTLFRHFVCEMADHALQGEALAGLSATYDYPVWAGRAMPVHYVLRRLAGAGDLPWVRLANVVFSLAMLLATYGLARRLLPAGQRKWAVFLLLVLPFQTFVVADYSHHLFSSFYFLLGMWIAGEMVLAPSGPRRWLVLALAAGVCLLLMAWQRGIHLIAAGTWFLLAAWTAVAAGWRRGGRLAIGLIAIPVILAVPLARQFDQRLAQHDAHHLNSILPAFMARGWCPESGGEYCGRYEQLDKATPASEKAPAMYRLVLSQIRRDPWTACVKLPLLKTAKLFLVGYAANFEESLAAAGSPALSWVRGMRLAAAPVFLGLAVWGCWLLCFQPEAQRRWLLVLLAPTLTWGTYVFFGESSPRYSIFCQPFLGLLGAWTLASLAGQTPGPPVRPVAAAGSFAWRAVICVGGAILALALLAGIVHRLPGDRFYADLQQGWRTPESGMIRPGSLPPFEAQICQAPESQPARGEWRLPTRREGVDTLSLYLLEVDEGLRTACLVIACPGSQMEIPLTNIQVPQQLKMPLPRAAEHLSISLAPSAAAVMPAGCLDFGYLGFLASGN